MACGLRAFTLLIYLNDVPDGGETVFTKLNVSVAPRKGAAVLWSAAPREATNDARAAIDARHRAGPTSTTSIRSTRSNASFSRNSASTRPG